MLVHDDIPSIALSSIVALSPFPDRKLRGEWKKWLDEHEEQVRRSG